MRQLTGSLVNPNNHFHQGFLEVSLWRMSVIKLLDIFGPLCPRHRWGGGIKQSCYSSVCLFHTPSYYIYGYYSTLIGNPCWKSNSPVRVAVWPPEVAKMSQGQTFTSSKHPKPSKIQPWLPVNVNRKSQAAYHLPRSSESPNHRKSPELPSAEAYRFAAIQAIPLVNN